FLAAHEYRDAIVRARDHQTMTFCLKPGRATPAQSVSQRNGADVFTGFELVERVLERGAHLIRAIMESNVKPSDLGDAWSVRREKFDFFFKYPTCKKCETVSVHCNAGHPKFQGAPGA